MKNNLLAGSIAGFISGLSGVLFGGLGNYLNLYGKPPISVIDWTIYWIIITTILGSLFGVIYDKIYNAIPGTGVSKGIRFGLGIWFIKDIATAIYLGFERANVNVLAVVWVGFFIWFVYGLIIGKLYRK